MVSASGKKELDTFAGAAAKKFSLFHKNRTVRESARRENLSKGVKARFQSCIFPVAKSILHNILILYILHDCVIPQQLQMYVLEFF